MKMKRPTTIWSKQHLFNEVLKNDTQLSAKCVIKPLGADLKKPYKLKILQKIKET